MGRWYQAATPEFVDYSEGITSSKGGKGATTPTALSLIGEMDVLPEDWGRHQEKLASVDSQINEITARMQADPRRANRYLPDVQRLKQDILRDTTAGEWAAMKERKRLVSEWEAGLEDVAKKDPALAYMARQKPNYYIPPLDYDEQTKTFGKPQFPMIETYSPEQARAWEDNLRESVKDRILKKTGMTVDKINPLQSIITVGESVGVTRDDILETAIGMVDPKALLASETRRRLSEGLEGKPTNIDERNFYTRDANGKIQLNLDTDWGRRIESLARGLERENFKRQTINFTDLPGRIKAEEASAKRKMNYEQRLKREDETIDLYPDVKSIMEGKDYNMGYSPSDVTRTKETPNPVTGQVEPGVFAMVKKDNSFAGVEYKGGKIRYIEKQEGLPPKVVIDTKVQGRDVLTTVPFDMDFIRDITNKATFLELEKKLKANNEWTGGGSIGIQSQDIFQGEEIPFLDE